MNNYIIIGTTTTSLSTQYCNYFLFSMSLSHLFVTFILALISLSATSSPSSLSFKKKTKNDQHVLREQHLAINNNWAVLICTSKYFFNYRHLSNVLAMYRVVKDAGIPDSQIILMNALPVQCDSRNRYPGHMYDTDEDVPYMKGELYMTQNSHAMNNISHTLTKKLSSVRRPRSLCDGGVEVDYAVSQ